MFCQKASDPAEEATAVEATAVAGVTGHRQERPGAAAIRPQGHTAARYGQVLVPVEQVPAEATVAALLPAHHDRAQRGQAAQYVKDRVPRAARRPVPLCPQET